jgi:hypothetical protein
MIPLPVIFAVVAAVAGATGAWSYQEARYGKQIADIHSTNALAFAAAQKEAHDTTIRLQAAKDEALRLAAVRQRDLARAAAAARSERDGLLNDLAASRVQLPDASCASVRDHAATLSSVFGECAAEIEGLAGPAQGHAIDSLKLQQAWPKKDSNGDTAN